MTHETASVYGCAQRNTYCVHIEHNPFASHLTVKKTRIWKQAARMLPYQRFTALTTERPYKAALPFARATEELRGEAARGWRRADLVATFLDQVDVAN